MEALLIDNGIVRQRVYGLVGDGAGLAPMVLPASDYAEATVGSPLPWPRARRNALLSATDYCELPSWRAGKAVDLLAEIDVWRQSLRNLPASVPAAVAAAAALAMMERGKPAI